MNLAIESSPIGAILVAPDLLLDVEPAEVPVIVGDDLPVVVAAVAVGLLVDTDWVAAGDIC